MFRRGVTIALALMIGAATNAPAQLLEGEKAREAWQRVPDLVAALNIGPGSNVADVGAGGRVFAVDVSASPLARLRRRMADEHLDNVTVVQGDQPPGSRPDVASLGFLLGDWDAIGTPAGEKGGFTFVLGVQNRVMTRTNYATYDARDGRAASRHDDLMVIYAEDSQLKADYFDSEQHVIRYLVEPRSDHEVVFVSDSKPWDPRYRLRYTAREDGTLAGQFEIAAPGTLDAFKPYLSWTARKRQ